MEQEEQFTISDSNGAEFRICSMPLGFDLCDGRFRVGHVYCTFFGDFMELNDLCIENSVIRPSHTFWGRIFHQRKIVNYRNHGLGSALLRFIIAHARAKGATFIKGRIVKKDILETPTLVEWYEKRGFAVTKLPGSGDFATIALELAGTT